MAMDGGNECDDDELGSGPSTPGRSNEDDTTVAEAHELLCDQLHHEYEFEEAGRAEASEHNDDSSESGTDEDMPAMVGRMKDDASSDDSSSGSYLYHTDNNNSIIEDSNDDCSPMPGLQEKWRDDSSSDDSALCQEERVKNICPKILSKSAKLHCASVPNSVVRRQRYQQKTKERNVLEAQRVDNQSRIDVEPRTVIRMNERVPPRKLVNDSINETLSGFAPLTYSKERSNFRLPSGLKPKNTLAHTSNNESSPGANTGCNKSSYRNPTILLPINQNSIDRSIIPPWLYEVEDNDNYDADHEEDIVLSKLGTIEPIQLRGGETVIVETVTEEETKEGIEELEQPPSQTIHTSHIPTTTKKIQPSIQTEFDPMKDDPPPAIITPSYEPLMQKISAFASFMCLNVSSYFRPVLSLIPLLF